MKTLQLYIFLFLLSWFPSTLVAQSGQVIVKKIPFPNKDEKTIYQTIQDSTGLLWHMSFDGWYVSDGEKIIAEPLSAIFKNRGFVRGTMDFEAPDGNFYLGGDSLRIFNPYSRKIVKAIGIDTQYDIGNEQPSIWMFLNTLGNDHWAVLTTHHINDNNQLVKGGNTILYSENGQPLKKVVNMPYLLYSQSVSARTDRIFVSATDKILEYNNHGKLISETTLPKTGVIPLCVKNKVAANEAIQFFHFAKDERTGQMNRALYELAPNATEFKITILPELNGISCHRFEKVGNYYWLEGEGMALHRFSMKTREIVDFSKFILQQYPDLSYFGSTINNVYEDKTGILWVTTQNNWVLKITNGETPFTRYLGERRQYPFCFNKTCVIRGITGDGQGTIYIAYDFGIYQLNLKTGQERPLNLNFPVKLNEVYSLTYYNGKLYLNDLEINLNTGIVKPLFPSEDVGRKPHYIDKKTGMMWLSDSYWNVKRIKIYQYDLNTQEGKVIGEINNSANTLHQVSQFHYSPTTNTLFMATLGNGICEMDKDGNVRQYITADKSKAKSDSISLTYSIYEDANQQLWIGHLHGLSKLDLKTRWYKSVTSKGDFESTQTFSILPENETYCWLGTRKGLYRLNVKTDELRGFEMFPSQKNMEFNRFATHQSKDGRLYLGSVEGVFSFYPNELTKASRIEEQFPIQLFQVSKYDNRQDTIIHSQQNLSNLSTIHIYPHHQYFNLEVFISDFRDAERNTYRWWLKGYEARWSVPSNNNSIRYNNLPVGKYTLHIQGGITDDYYEGSERQITIIVHQAWYKSWWAWLIYLALFLGVVYFVSKYFLREQLEKAEAKRLKELDNLKSRLYTNITHEFRTPLTVIMGMTNNIKGHSKEKELIERNSKNLLILINQLLDLSKLDSNQLQVENVQGNIVNYLQYLTESFYSMATDKRIRLMFYPEVKSLTMDYDEAKIQHIVYNLLSNAIKFTPEEGKVIFHINKVEQQGKPWLHMKVSDTGVGIASSDLSKIFDRFYQADASSTRKRGGTGIGLALTKELVETMGGTVAVESKVGKGTDFLILLPIIKEAHTPIAKAKIKTSNKPQKETITKNSLITEPTTSELPTLLVIEDNRDVVTYIESLLENDYSILIARNGQEGIEKAIETIPDIIISDVMMPEKNGYEVCQFLKNDERTSHIPIILLTAKATTEARIEGLKGGADAYLTKPFNKKELFIRLEQLITLRKSLQERYANIPAILSFNSKKKEPSLDELFLQKLTKVVEDRLDDPSLAVVHLCQAANLSNMQVNRKLKALTGKTPSRFIRSIRLQAAMNLLKTTDLNISEIAYDVGFSDPNYFSRTFSEEFGFAPNVIRK